MSSLSPPAPPPNRHRASSTNVCPPLTLATLGRRRSSSLVDIPPTPSEPTTSVPPTPRPKAMLSLSIPSTREKPAPQSKLVSLFSRWTESFYLSSEQSFPSTPSSPLHSRASTDDSSILPMSASPTRAYFGDFALPEKPQAKLKAKARLWEGRPSVRIISRRSRDHCLTVFSVAVRPPQVHTPVLFVLILLPLSTAFVGLCMSTLPITTAWPRTLPDLAQLGRELHGYTQSGLLSIAHVVGVISVVTIWMHSWSIPGSVLAVRVMRFECCAFIIDGGDVT